MGDDVARMVKNRSGMKQRFEVKNVIVRRSSAAWLPPSPKTN